MRDETILTSLYENVGFAVIVAHEPWYDAEVGPTLGFGHIPQDQLRGEHVPGFLPHISLIQCLDRDERKIQEWKDEHFLRKVRVNII